MASNRILCVTSSLPRWTGDSTTPFVLHLAQDLQALGWEVDILAPHAPGAATAETLGTVRVERFRYLWPERLETVCYQGGALINLRKDPMNWLKLPGLVAVEWAEVARRLARRHYDLLHTHWILPQGFVGMLTRWIDAIPHVLTVHGGDLFGLRGQLLRRVKSMVLRGADTVTVNSRYTESAVRALVPLPRRLELIPMGVATELPDATIRRQARAIRARYRRGAGPLLLFVGRVIDEKGPEDLIRAVAHLRPRVPEVTALIVGDGQDRPHLQELVAELGLADCIRFLGWVQPAEVGTWLAAADCFVGPSRRAPNGWVEAQGVTLSEAMIAGTPVIATRLGGVPDTVIHEETGLLVDECAPDQIAAAVLRVVADPDLARGLTERGRRHAATRFSRRASAAAFSELFSQLVPRRPGARE